MVFRFFGGDYHEGGRFYLADNAAGDLDLFTVDASVMVLVGHLGSIEARSLLFRSVQAAPSTPSSLIGTRQSFTTSSGRLSKRSPFVFP